MSPDEVRYRLIISGVGGKKMPGIITSFSRGTYISAGMIIKRHLGLN